MTLSRGPLVERMVNRYLTSAGSPHRTALSSSRQAGQLRNIIVASVIHIHFLVDLTGKTRERRGFVSPSAGPRHRPGDLRVP